MIKFVTLIFIFLFASVQLLAQDLPEKTRKLERELETELRTKYQYSGLGFGNPHYGSASEEEYYEGLKKFKEALAKTEDPISFSSIDILFISGEDAVESSTISRGVENFFFSTKEPFGAYIKLLSRNPENEPYYKEYRTKKEEEVLQNLRGNFGDWYEFHNIGQNILCNQEIPVDELGLKEYIEKNTEHKVKEVKSFNLRRSSQGRIHSDITIVLDTKPPLGIDLKRSIEDSEDFFEISIRSSERIISFFDDKYTLSKFDNACEFQDAKSWEYNESGSIAKRQWFNSWGQQSRVVYGNRKPLSLEEIYEPCKGTEYYDYIQEVAQRTDQVLVTILDSGVDYNHPEIAYKIKRPKVSENESLKARLLDILQNSRSRTEAEQLIIYLERDLELQKIYYIDSPKQLFELDPLEDETIFEDKLKKLQESIDKQQKVYDEMNFALKWYKGKEIQDEISDYRREMELTQADLDSVKRRNKMTETYNQRMREENEFIAERNQVIIQRQKEKEEKIENIKLQLKTIKDELEKSESQISDLKTRIKANAIGWDFQENDDEPYDYSDHALNISESFDHGTHVAGIASEGSDDIAILPVKYPKAKTEKFYEAIVFAHERGSRIVNISLGGDDKEFWDYLSKAMTDYPDMLFVVAAGNEEDDLDSTPHYPAAFDHPNMLVVAAVDEDNRLSDYSNYSKTKVDVAAPGDEILSLSTENTHDEKSGTSMATPFVTRIAAKIKYINPTLSPRQIIAIIRDSVTPVEELRFKVKYGGVVNEEKAIEIAQGTLK